MSRSSERVDSYKKIVSEISIAAMINVREEFCDDKFRLVYKTLRVDYRTAANVRGLVFSEVAHGEIATYGYLT